MLRLSYCEDSGTCGDTLYNGPFAEFVRNLGGHYEGT